MKTRRPVDYNRNPLTLGEHLKKKRRLAGLLQKQVALSMKVDLFTYLTWETDRCQPSIIMWPKILSHLEYDPAPPPITCGQRIAAYRRVMGLSLKKLAKQIGCDPTTLSSIESGKTHKLSTTLEKKLEGFVFKQK